MCMRKFICLDTNSLLLLKNTDSAKLLILEAVYMHDLLSSAYYTQTNAVIFCFRNNRLDNQLDFLAVNFLNGI